MVVKYLILAHPPFSWPTTSGVGPPSAPIGSTNHRLHPVGPQIGPFLRALRLSPRGTRSCASVRSTLPRSTGSAETGATKTGNDVPGAPFAQMFINSLPTQAWYIFFAFSFALTCATTHTLGAGWFSWRFFVLGPRTGRRCAVKSATQKVRPERRRESAEGATSVVIIYLVGCGGFWNGLLV